jgi:hypothetical protein
LWLLNYRVLGQFMKQDPHVSEIVWNHFQTTYFCTWLKYIRLNHKLSNKHVFLLICGHHHEKPVNLGNVFVVVCLILQPVKQQKCWYALEGKLVWLLCMTGVKDFSVIVPNETIKDELVSFVLTKRQHTLIWMLKIVVLVCG